MIRKYGAMAVLVALLASLIVVGIGHAQAGAVHGSTCNIMITGFNSTYNAPQGGACGEVSVNVSAGASQNRIECAPGSAEVGGVTFGNDSFNNTLFNCTFSSAVIRSLDNASNNLISSYGKYSLSFADNLSNIGIGYYFTFVSKDYRGVPSRALFINLVPFALTKPGFSFIDAQDLAIGRIHQVAAYINYTLPRFGYYASVNSTGVMHFALEQKQVYRNRTMNFNPYWFVTPYWGWDELSYKEFNITANTNYTPTLLYPTMPENVRFPDNTTIYWNYTIIRYSNATNMTLYIDRGWQGDLNNTVAYVLHNVTNGTVSYKVGVQQPGIYEYIGILKSPQAAEHDNSTTETYGIGLPYCQIGDASQILYPGYYSMPYKNLSILHTFWLNGSLCNVPVDIIVSNVTIDCRGGNINSNNVSIEINSVKNTRIENCNIYGNGFRIDSASNVTVLNTNVIADTRGDIAFNISDSSNVLLDNVHMVGYANYSRIVSLGSSVTTNSISYNNTMNFTFNNTINPYNNTSGNAGGSTANATITIRIDTPSRHAPPPITYYYLVYLFVAIIAICVAVYYLVSGSGGRAR